MPAKWYAENRAVTIQRATEWNKRNPEKRRATLRRYAEKHRESERLRSQRRRKADPKKELERLKKWQRNARKNNPQFIVKTRLRTRLRHAFKKGLGKKVEGTLVLVGCSFDELRAHIEKQFKNGMCWTRISEIEIDHIIPCSKFDLTDAGQRRRCFHFTNLQPLWKPDNRSKGNKIRDGQLSLGV